MPTLSKGPALVSDTKDKADLLNVFFCEQCRVDDYVLPEMEYLQNYVFLSEVQTSEREKVCEMMKRADVSKACGEDGNNIIKISAQWASCTFTRILKKSLSCGVFPQKWKLANIIQLFKSDDRQCNAKLIIDLFHS